MATKIYRELTSKYPESRFARAVSEKLQALKKPEVAADSVSTQLAETPAELKKVPLKIESPSTNVVEPDSTSNDKKNALPALKPLEEDQKPIP